MQAFEFEAITQDGIIKIPRAYAEKVPRKVKVILLADHTEKKELEPFPYLGIDTSGYVFDREEANAR